MPRFRCRFGRSNDAASSSAFDGQALVGHPQGPKRRCRDLDPVFQWHGMALFCVYARARWRDAQHCEKLPLDKDSKGQAACVEGPAAVHRTDLSSPSSEACFSSYGGAGCGNHCGKLG